MYIIDIVGQTDGTQDGKAEFFKFLSSVSTNMELLRHRKIFNCQKENSGQDYVKTAYCLKVVFAVVFLVFNLYFS